MPAAVSVRTDFSAGELRRLAVPKNITLVFLPSRVLELNPVENVWQYLRANWLSNCWRAVAR